MQSTRSSFFQPRPALAWAGLVFLLALPAAAQQMSVALHPAIAFFNAKPGQIAQEQFNFENKGSAELVLEMDVSDAWYAEDGNRSFPRSGTAPQGTGSWMSAPPEQLVIAPGKTAGFTGRIQIPDGTAPGTYYGAYLGKVREEALQVDPMKKKETHGMGRMVARVAVLVVIDVVDETGKKIVPQLKVIAHEIKASEGEAAQFAFRLENPTRSGVRATGQILLLDTAQNPIGKVDFQPFTLWAGQKLWIRDTFTAPLPRGAYTAVAAFEAPEVPVVSVTVPFESKPRGPSVMPAPERAKPVEPAKPSKGNRAKKGAG